MAYKYYLELLRKGLHEEFFAEMRQGMLPFFNDTTYGRSILECSSFIASSSFEDPSVVGQGFLPRLSGSTAEFMSIWTLMMIGPSPFFINEDGNLVFGFKPSLPSWFLAPRAPARRPSLPASFAQLVRSHASARFWPLSRAHLAGSPLV